MLDLTDCVQDVLDRCSYPDYQVLRTPQTLVHRGMVEVLDGRASTHHAPPLSPGLAARVRDFELSPSGPIFGARTLRAEGAAGELEDALLAAAGLTREDFGSIGFGVNQNGARRPLRVPVAELEVERDEGLTRLAFSLPRGAYATTLLEELRKEHRRP